MPDDPKDSVKALKKSQLVVDTRLQSQYQAHYTISVGLKCRL